MAWGAHVRVDATVGSVGSPAHFGGSVDVDVLNNKRIDIESLKISIALSVFQKIQEEGCTLLWPSTLSGTKFFGLGGRSTTLLVDNILQVLCGTSDVKTLDGLSCLSGVFKVDTEVCSPCLARLARVGSLTAVPSHFSKKD